MPPQNEKPVLLPIRKQSLSQAVGDIFTTLLQPERTGLDPQEIGRGYSVQQPDPVEAMPSTPKGFKTVKSLDDFISVDPNLRTNYSEFWKKARNRLEQNIRFLRHKGEIETKGASISDDVEEFFFKKYGIKDSGNFLHDLPDNIDRVFEKDPKLAKKWQPIIKNDENRIENLKDKPILLRYTPTEELDAPELLRGRSELKGNESLLRYHKGSLKSIEERIKSGYEFILENKNQLIKGFNDFVRKTDKEMEQDVKRVFTTPKLTLLEKDDVGKINSLVHETSQIGGTKLGDVAKIDYGLGGKNSSYKGLTESDYESRSSYIKGLKEWRDTYIKMFEDDVIDDDQYNDVKKVFKKIDKLVSENEKKFPSLKSIKPTDNKKTELIDGLIKDVKDQEETASKAIKDKIIAKESGEIPKSEVRNWSDFSKAYEDDLKETRYKGYSRKYYKSDEERLTGFLERYRNYSKIEKKANLTDNFRESLNDEINALYQEIKDIRSKLNKKD